MAKKLNLSFRGRNYKTDKPLDEIRGLISMGFDPRHVWTVRMKHKKTGELREMDWGHQVTEKDALNEAAAHMSLNYEILDARPILTKVNNTHGKKNKGI